MMGPWFQALALGLAFCSFSAPACSSSSSSSSSPNCPGLQPPHTLKCSTDLPQPFCLPENYTRFDRPRMETEGDGDGDGDLFPPPLPILSGFMIDDVSDVEDNNCAVKLVITMRFSWRESRMTIDEPLFVEKLHDPASRHQRQSLDMHHELGRELWMPDFFMANMRKLGKTGFLDHPSVKFSVSLDKTIQYTKYAQLTFMCPMEFESFPFDIHVCNLKIHSLGDMDDSLAFYYEGNGTTSSNGGGIAWKSQTILEHSVSFESLDPKERFVNVEELDGQVKRYSATGVKITLMRKYLPFIIDYYLPSGLFVVVSWTSFLVPPSIVPGRMALLVTLFLMLVNISTSATTHSPKSDQINALQVWLLTCILFVFMALLEYSVLLYLKNMKGFHRHVFAKSGLLVVTPTKDPEDCWSNQQTDALERKLKMVDFSCVLLFPFVFAAFNIVYWSMQYSISFSQKRKIATM